MGMLFGGIAIGLIAFGVLTGTITFIAAGIVASLLAVLLAD